MCTFVLKSTRLRLCTKAYMRIHYYYISHKQSVDFIQLYQAPALWQVHRFGVGDDDAKTSLLFYPVNSCWFKAIYKLYYNKSERVRDWRLEWILFAVWSLVICKHSANINEWVRMHDRIVHLPHTVVYTVQID